MSTFEITARGIYLFDIGSETYTEFSPMEQMLDVFDTYPQLEDPEGTNYKMGKIHSHHNMNAYHSGTDVQDLHDQAETHAYYVSLVVNYDKEYDCEIAIKCKEEDRKLVYKDGKGSTTHSIIKGADYLLRVDCYIDMDIPDLVVPEHITKQFDKLNAPKVKPMNRIQFTPRTQLKTPSYDTNPHVEATNRKMLEVLILRTVGATYPSVYQMLLHITKNAMGNHMEDGYVMFTDVQDLYGDGIDHTEVIGDCIEYIESIPAVDANVITNKVTLLSIFNKQLTYVMAMEATMDDLGDLEF